MNWGSLHNFLAMGGYARYVWGAYGVTALFIAAEIALLAARRRTLLRRLSRIRRISSELGNEAKA